ncbi:MAG: hypothetical protein QOI20_3411 [Acidimicrobiaceae bacterium]|nr:hypothetical protein [Acidimicrobiaceae bacterium]
MSFSLNRTTSSATRAPAHPRDPPVPRSGVGVAVARLRLTPPIQEDCRRGYTGQATSTVLSASVDGLCLHPLVEGLLSFVLFLGHCD